MCLIFFVAISSLFLSQPSSVVRGRYSDNKNYIEVMAGNVFMFRPIKRLGLGIVYNTMCLTRHNYTASNNIMLCLGVILTRYIHQHSCEVVASTGG